MSELKTYQCHVDVDHEQSGGPASFTVTGLPCGVKDVIVDAHGILALRARIAKLERAVEIVVKKLQPYDDMDDEIGVLMAAVSGEEPRPWAVCEYDTYELDEDGELTEAAAFADMPPGAGFAVFYESKHDGIARALRVADGEEG